MKSRSKTFSVFLCVLLLLTQSLHIQAYSRSNNPDDDIKRVIYELFENELLSIQAKKPKQNSNIITKQDTLAYYDKKNHLATEWYSKLKLNLLDYKIYIDYIQIDYQDENNCIVELEKGVDLVFDIAPDVVQEARNDAYTIELTKKNKKWYISYVTSPEDVEYYESIKIKKPSKDDKDKNTKRKLNETSSNLDNIDLLVKEYTNTLVTPNPLVQTSIVASSTSVTYDAYAAVSYARLWANSRNPAFQDFGNEDCTNFVSQCILNGGPRMNNTWYTYWEPVTILGSTVRYWYTSPEWCNVISFYNYWTTNGYGYGQIGTSGATMGDPLQLYNRYSNTWSHCVIVSLTDSSGNLYYCGHSSNRKDYALYNVYPGSNYSNVRVIRMY